MPTPNLVRIPDPYRGNVPAPSPFSLVGSGDYGAPLIIRKTFTASDTAVVVIAAAPFKLEILDFSLLVTTQFNATVKLQDGQGTPNDVSGTISGNSAAGTIVRATTLVPAQVIIDKGEAIGAVVSAAGLAGQIRILAIAVA